MYGKGGCTGFNYFNSKSSTKKKMPETNRQREKKRLRTVILNAFFLTFHFKSTLMENIRALCMHFALKIFQYQLKAVLLHLSGIRVIKL